MIQFRQSYEGNGFEFETEDGYSQSGSYKLLQISFNISKDEAIKSGPEAYFSRIQQIAKDWIDQQSRLLFEKMEEVTATTGNIATTAVKTAEFKPNYPFEVFKWNCKEGKLLDLLFKAPQSWKDLQMSASDINLVNLPKYLLNPFCYYFLICYPQRLSRHTGKLIDL